jgi:heme-degrading monooxygenase HmoA
MQRVYGSRKPVNVEAAVAIRDVVDQSSEARDHEDAPCAVVSTMSVDPGDCDRLVQVALDAGRYMEESVPGFIEARVLASNDRTRVLIYARWETRGDWSRSQWDGVVQSALAKVYAIAGKVEFTLYGRAETISETTIANNQPYR